MKLNEMIRQHGLDEREEHQLREYIKNRYESTQPPFENSSELIKPFKSLAAMAQLFGAAEIINKKLCPAHPVSYRDPDSVRLEIYDSFAGEIPVIYAGNSTDFEALVTNIVNKGVRDESISSTGASFVYGKSVRFLIVSAKPYSNVSAAELGLDDEEWHKKSMQIRLSHECTHYFTKQEYGISENNLHDELMADFTGIYNAFGFYRAEWFLRFMGIISGGGSRFSVYTGGLFKKAAGAAADITVQAAACLEKWSETENFRKLTDAERIRLMCRLGIEGMLEGSF